MTVGVRADARQPDLAVRRWSTEDVDAREALDYWRDSVCHAILELGVEAPQDESFRARLEQCTLGPATLNLIEATRQSVARTRSAISRSRGAVFHLLHLRAGQFQLEHADGTTALHPGDCVLVDSTEPHAARCPVPTRCLIVQFPQEWLRAWLPEPANIVDRALRPQGGWSSALAAALASLRPDNLDGLALPHGVVAEQLAALLALTAGPGAPHPPRREQLHGRILGTLHDRYYEVSLSPGAVAAAHGISKRYLHLLLARAGTTFGEELLRVRLERARQLLSDARFADVPIGEIASRCGFADPSHFARCFRRSFGSAPGAYRSGLRRFPRPLALGGAQGDDAARTRPEG
jgi:AraC family transcriptional regulator, positive regulator of tynA and feaB